MSRRIASHCVQSNRLLSVNRTGPSSRKPRGGATFTTTCFSPQVDDEMSQKTDRNADQGDGGGVPQAMLRVFRDSMRRASGGKGAKVAAGQDAGSPSSPPSPGEYRRRVT